ncbi:MAG: CHAT domain-containing protein [Deltaproteobacteria bacterium]|nr:CHAT domain-containing protein [Deltaproteobacteria bacterium]
MTAGPGSVGVLITLAVQALAGAVHADEGEARLLRLEEAFERGQDALVWDGASELLASLPAGAVDLTSRVLTLRGRVLGDEGHFAAAREQFDAALALLGGGGSVEARVEALVARVVVERAAGRTRAARAALAEADAWANGAARAPADAAAERVRALLALRAGRQQEARLALQRFVAVCAGSPCSSVADRIEGSLLALDGDLAGAADLLRRAEMAFAREGRSREQLDALVERVEVERALGDRDQARAAAAIGAGLAARIGHARHGAELNRILGELALEAGDATEATRLLEMARKAFTDMHALSGIAGSRLALGRVALLGGRAPEARIHFEAARVLYEEMADEGRIQTAWRGLAAAARSGGDVAAERRWLGELALSGSPGARWEAASRLAELAEAEGDPAEVRRFAGLALEDLQRLDARLGTPAARETLAAARQRASEMLVEAWLTDADVEAQQARVEALEAADRSLARGFVELLDRAGSTRALPATARLAQRVAAIDRAMALAAGGDPAFDAEALHRLGHLRGRLEAELRHQLGSASDRLQGAPGHRGRVAALVGALGDEVAVVAYHLGAVRSRAFVLTSAGTAVVALAPRARLEALARDLHERLRARPSGARERRERDAAARAAYRALLEPVVGQLGSRRRVVIIPQGALRIVPFDALVTSPSGRPRYALEEFVFSQAPSLAALATLRGEDLRRRARVDRFPFVGFAAPAYDRGPARELPELAGAALEVELARRRLGADAGPGTLFTGPLATERRLEELALDRYAIVHLATHTSASDSTARGSTPALFLAPGEGEDGLVQWDEVLRLRLDADLVVLSACDTARGDLHAGDGFDGLTGAFLRAGASEVLASLWEVEDTVTPTLMDRFYEALAGGESAPAALRLARLAMLRGEATVHPLTGAADVERSRRVLARARDPFYWAPFVVVGSAGDVFR